MDELVVNPITVTYLGEARAEVASSGGRAFTVEERSKVGQEGAKFCPIELVASGLGA